MRKFILITPVMVVLFVLGLVLSSCGSTATTTSSTEAPSASTSAPSAPTTATTAASTEPYKIGLLTTLTGPLGFLGLDTRDTVQMEVDRINAAGGINGHLIELIVEDDGQDPGKAVSGFTKLVKQDNVLAVTGVEFSFLEAALRPMAEREGVTLIDLAPATPKMRERKDTFTFNIPTSEFNRVGAWLDMLKENNFTKVVGISENDEVSKASLDELKREGAAEGITVDVLPDLVNVTDVDITPQVTKLKELIAKTNAQVVVNTLYPPNIPAMLTGLTQMGVKIPQIGWDGAADGSLLKMGGAELNGMILNGTKVLAGTALPDSDPQKAVIVDFNTRYTAKTGRQSGATAAASFDAINMIAKALTDAGADRAKIRDSIEGLTDYVGATGVFNYTPTDHEGLTKASYAVYVIEKQTFVFKHTIQ